MGSSLIPKIDERYLHVSITKTKPIEMMWFNYSTHHLVSSPRAVVIFQSENPPTTNRSILALCSDATQNPVASCSNGRADTLVRNNGRLAAILATSVPPPHASAASLSHCRVECRAFAFPGVIGGDGDRGDGAMDVGWIGHEDGSTSGLFDAMS
jgi:hypothetical protein